MSGEASRSPTRLATLLRSAVAATLLAVTPATVFAGAEPVVPSTDVPATASAPAVTDNAFLPEDENLTDCISSLPRPGCGSRARGGWHQGLTFGVMLLAIVIIGVRLTVAVRRRDRHDRHAAA